MKAQSAGLAHYGSVLTDSSPTQKHKNEKEMGKTHLFFVWCAIRDSNHLVSLKTAQKGGFSHVVP